MLIGCLYQDVFWCQMLASIFLQRSSTNLLPLGFRWDFFLLCAPGLVYPTETKFISHLRNVEKSQQEESIPLIPSTLQDLEEMLRLCCYNPPKLPRQVQSYATWAILYFQAFIHSFAVAKCILPQQNLSPTQNRQNCCFLICYSKGRFMAVSGQYTEVYQSQLLQLLGRCISRYGVGVCVLQWLHNIFSSYVAFKERDIS